MDQEMMQATLGEDASESFEELIAGRYHEDFTRKMQQIIDRRFAEHQAKEANWEKWVPAIEKLCANRGLAADDAEGLTALLDGLADQRERQEQLRAWAACQALQGWMEEAAGLQEQYPVFDLAEAAASEDFMALLRKGLSVRQAWELCHQEDLMMAAMEATAAHVRELTARQMMQRQARPREAGLLARSAAVSRPSMRDSSRAQREELERRALRGEKIVM